MSQDTTQQIFHLTSPSMGSSPSIGLSIAPNPFEERKDCVVLPKAMKNPNIAKSFSSIWYRNTNQERKWKIKNEFINWKRSRSL